MAMPTVQASWQDLSYAQLDQHDSRPLKKRRIDASHPTLVEAEEAVTLVRRHPLGVRPSGNALTSYTDSKASCGQFSRLPDELIAQFLETLQVPHLLRLGATCRALHAFTRSEELWRALFVE